MPLTASSRRSCFLLRSADTYSTIVSLASSDGWNDMSPTKIQRRAPMTDSPTPGAKGSSSSTKVARSRGGTAARTSSRGVQRGEHRRAHAQQHPQPLALHKVRRGPAEALGVAVGRRVEHGHAKAHQQRGQQHQGQVASAAIDALHPSPYWIFSVERPTSANSPPRIQKRITTLLSCQPASSKW